MPPPFLLKNPFFHTEKRFVATISQKSAPKWVFGGKGRRVPKIHLTQGQPKGCTSASLGCFREEMFSRTLWPLPKTTCFFPEKLSINFPGEKRHINIPSDTKLLLTKNYSNIIIFEKLRIWYVIPWKSPSFPEISKVWSPSTITKNNSQGIIFVIILCQRVNFLLWLTPRWPWDKRLVVPGLTGPKSLCVRLETQEI